MNDKVDIDILIVSPQMKKIMNTIYPFFKLRSKFLLMFLICTCIYLNGCKSLMDAFLTPTTATSSSQSTPANCPDVEYLGLFVDEGVPGVKIYFVKLRNKGTYTQNVTIQFTDMYGQTEKASFNVGAGAIVDGRIATLQSVNRRPLNVMISSCY